MNHAVQILIQRMQTHPEDFFGPLEPLHTPKTLRMQKEPHPKFRHIAVQIERHIIGAKDRDESSADSLWHLTAAEREALRRAFTEARRVRFDAEVFHTLMVQPEPELPRKNVVLTTSQMTNQALSILEDELAKDYTYNTKDRYNF